MNANNEELKRIEIMKKQKTIEEKVKILLPLPTYVEEVLNENEILFEKDDDEPNYRIGIHGECVE